jgi:hypothetical protein
MGYVPGTRIPTFSANHSRRNEEDRLRKKREEQICI